MNPHLHHARVHAAWILRRPFVAGLGVTLLGLSGVVFATVGNAPLPQSTPLPATLSDVILALMVGMFGLIAGATTGPSRGGQRLLGETLPLPALPLTPGGRVAGEAGAALVVWAVLLLPVLALVSRLPEAGGPTLLHVAREMGGWATAGLPFALVCSLPALVVSRRQTTMGEPSAVGTLLLGGVLTWGVVVATHWGLPAGLIAGVAGGWLGHRLTPGSERAVEALIQRALSLAPRIKTSAQPWHTRTGFLARRACLQVAPISLGYALFFLPIELIDGAPKEMRLGFLLPLILLAAAPALVPLALNGRTASPAGRGVPFDGTFREAWRMLPVEPRTLRTVALKHAGVGYLLTASLLILGWFLGRDVGALMADTPTLILLLMGLLALTPVFAAITLGSKRQRDGATWMSALVMVAAMTHLFSQRPEFGVLSSIPVVLLVVAVAMAGWLTRALLRPSEDEVRGAHQLG